MTPPEAEATGVPRILFVEDEEALVSAYRRFFGERYQTAFATTGEQGMEQLDSFRPDLLVLDMRLPDTDGVDLLRRIRSRQPTLPVIVTTAYASMQPLLEVMGLDYSAFLPKPFELSELEQLIQGIT